MTLDWFIIAWLNDREWVSKAQRLLDEVVGEDRMPQWEDRSKLLYIDAIGTPPNTPPNQTVEPKPILTPHPSQ